MIDEIDAKALLRGESINCSGHRHATRDESRLLALGLEKLPWAGQGKKYNGANFKPEARWATLADGSPSQRHLVMQMSYEWRTVTAKVSGERVGVVGIGYSSKQLVPMARRVRA